MDDVRAVAQRFFDEFVRDFPTFDGQVIARRYATPYVACHADGSIDGMATADEVAAYFQVILDRYRDGGVVGCRHRDLEASPLGAGALLGTVTWELLDAAGQVTTSWRESYNLLRTTDGVRVFASTDHP